MTTFTFHVSQPGSKDLKGLPAVQVHYGRKIHASGQAKVLKNAFLKSDVLSTESIYIYFFFN